jgi:dephospho-CoA kinase
MIVGITGSLGGGKGTVVDFLKDVKRFTHYSSSDLLVEILKERGETVDRDGMYRVANELRANNPEGGVPAETYKRYQIDGSPENAIFEALHNPAEVQFVQSIGGIVIGVTADPEVRYERISARGSVKDNVTKEEFLIQQKREEEGTGDPNKSSIFDALSQADYVIQNNGTIEELNVQIEKVLQKIE